MQSIEYNKENRPILNQIYNILAEQNKEVTLCKVPEKYELKEKKQ